MKNQVYTGLAGALLCLLSCTDLNEEVYSSIPADHFFKNERELISNAGRAYAMLQDYCTEQSLWTLNLQTADECCVPVNANGSWSEERYGQLQQHKYDQSNKLVRMGWEFCFNGIASCNEILWETEESTVDFPAKDQILAEIHVLRAFFYFMAVDGWGNVPFSIDFRDASYPEPKDRAFMFTWIEQEILDNLDRLADVPARNLYGRVTRDMANTLLAKLYMMAEKWTGTPRWDDAERACREVMNSGHYLIEPRYADNFSVTNEASRENIFSIVYSTVFTESDHNAFVIYIMTLHSESGKTYNIPCDLWDGFICQPDFFERYADTDTRRADTWLYGQQKDVNGQDIPGYVINPVFAAPQGREGRGKFDGAKLHKWEYQTDGLLRSDQVSMDNDFALFRYADVVLLCAEALVRQGKAAEALAIDEFKTIRQRAGQAIYTSLDLDELLDERGRELAWEGWRRQDLIRYGRYTSAWWGKPQTAESKELYPIPREVLAANPRLKQNPGY